MKNIIVLSPEVSKESAQALAEALDAELEFPYKTENRDYMKYDYVKRLRQRKELHLIRVLL